MGIDSREPCPNQGKGRGQIQVALHFITCYPYYTGAKERNIHPGPGLQDGKLMGIGFPAIPPMLSDIISRFYELSR